MRARGAATTDIVVLVVAADDGVMPQTIEALNHAQAADVPIVVAVNKIDKEDANPAKVRQQLTEYGLVAEEYGGDTLFVDVSARSNLNIDGLLEGILLTADAALDLRANPEPGRAGHRDRGPPRPRPRPGGHACWCSAARCTSVTRSSPATPSAASGPCSTRTATPSTTPARRVRSRCSASPRCPAPATRSSSSRRTASPGRSPTGVRRASATRSWRRPRRRVSLDDLDKALAAGEVEQLNLIIKGDVSGSVEALEDALLKIDIGDDNDEVSLRVIGRGVGAITENDINLAIASDAVVIGFNVRPEGKAREPAEREGVDVRYYTVIYQAIDEIEAALKGMLKPEFEEVQLGTAEVREVFRVPRIGNIAGSLVRSGMIRRNSKARLVRDGVVVADNLTVESLRRFKDDATEVRDGFECGIGLGSYNDIKIDDVIETFELREKPRA